MERRYGLRDEQWERLKSLGLPGSVDFVGVPSHTCEVTAKDNRLFVEAVLYRFRAGIPWRDLPTHFGKWHPIFVRFDRWSRRGVWQRVFEALSKEADNEYAMIDSTVVRAHRSAAGAHKVEERAESEAEKAEATATAATTAATAATAATDAQKKGALSATKQAAKRTQKPTGATAA